MAWVQKWGALCNSFLAITGCSPPNQPAEELRADAAVLAVPTAAFSWLMTTLSGFMGRLGKLYLVCDLRPQWWKWCFSVCIVYVSTAIQCVQDACVWCMHICTCWYELRGQCVTSCVKFLIWNTCLSQLDRLLSQDLEMSHHSPKWGQNLTIFPGKTLPVSARVLWASFTSVFSKCVCALWKEANWKWAWPPDASRASALTPTHPHMVHAHTRGHAHIHTCIHHLTQMFFPLPLPPSSFLFFPPTSPFQATQNGCKHRLPAGRVECLRGLHSLWSAVTDSPPCVWQLLGSPCLVAMWWSLRGFCNFPLGGKGDGWLYRKDAQVWVDSL